VLFGLTLGEMLGWFSHELMMLTIFFVFSIIKERSIFAQLKISAVAPKNIIIEKKNSTEAHHNLTF
jgi:hypothetical protein